MAELARPNRDDGTDRLPMAPSEERVARGDIEIANGPIKSDPGDYTAPYIAIDVLVRLEASNAITSDERRAGERFRSWFKIAQLDELRAADLARPFVDGGGAKPELSYQAEHARRQVSKAILWVGGLKSQTGSCLYHVVGLDHSFRRWAREQRESARNISYSNGIGILGVALERLSSMPWRGPWEKTS